MFNQSINKHVKSDALSITMPTTLAPRSTEINVVIHVDPSFSDSLDFDSLFAEYDGTYSPSSGAPYRGYYHLSSSVEYLELDEMAAFRDHLLSIADTDGPNGHAFDTAAFLAGNKSTCFPEISGASIDAEDTLDYVIGNLWDGSVNAYHLFMLNLTDLDNEFGTEHWFMTHPIDMDSNNEIHGFFSGTTGLTHGKQVNSWGGRQDIPVHFLDLSSRIWYSEWVDLAWGYGGYEHLAYTMSDFGQPVDIDDPAFQQYMSAWSRDFMQNLFAEPTFYVESPAETYSLQVLVIDNWTTNGYPSDQVDWVIDGELMEDKMEEAFPFFDAQADIQWSSFIEFPDLNAYMKAHSEWCETDQIFVVDASAVVSYVSDRLEEFFDMQAAEVVLPGLFFLMSDSVFEYAGMRIAGLGGMGWQLMGVQPARSFRPDDTTPERGLSYITLHEIGHSLGLPHPFDEYNGWGTDLASIMGYYSTYPHFGEYVSNSVGHFHSDNYLVQCEWLLAALIEARDDGLLNAQQTEDFQWATQTLDNALFAQLTWDYAEATIQARRVLEMFWLIVENTPLSSTFFITETSTTSSSSEATTTTPTDSSSSDAEPFSLCVTVSLMVAVCVVNVWNRRRARRT